MADPTGLDTDATDTLARVLDVAETMGVEYLTALAIVDAREGN